MLHSDRTRTVHRWIIFPPNSRSGPIASKPDGAWRQSAIQILHRLMQPPLGIFFGFPVKYQQRVIDVRVIPALLLEHVEQARLIRSGLSKLFQEAFALPQALIAGIPEGDRKRRPHLRKPRTAGAEDP